MIKTVGIVGLGALGVLYGSLLLEKMDREDLLIIADEERIRRYRAEGVCANGKKCEFHYVTPEEGSPVDLLIFTTKYMALAEAARMARPFCGEQTIVMSFLNGVSSEQMLEEILKPKRLLYSCVQGMDATRVDVFSAVCLGDAKNRQVTYSKAGYIAFGEKDSSRSEAVCEAEEFFGRTGLAYQVPEDIRHQIYSKWMLNVGVNQTCAVNDVDYEGVQRPGELRNIMITAMEEARSVAAAAGILLTEEELRGWVDVIDGLSPKGQPSMRQDVLAGRQTEVELFAGTVCAMGRKYGIPVPQNEKFYRLLK
ncbi:MAG: ketopantoate reductase family protein [Clostridiales bacterium]|nr:ketopantoate reductase family protein [Clostridiales bacterium]